MLAPDDSQYESLGLARAGVAVARAGGATRAVSAGGGLAALRALGARVDDWVLVHDAARCLVPPAAVRRRIEACRDDAVGGLLALPVADTLKRSTAASAHDERVETTVARTAIWGAQTPQMFRIGPLRDALRAGLARADLSITDEASAIEAQGLQPRLVRGDFENLKVTWPEDFALAERLLRGRAAQGAAHADDERARPETPSSRNTAAMSAPFRIGEGWDTHQLVAGRPLILGGVTVPHTHGLLGHSDADALAHAITDALLGAAALGDIGRHFPDTDERFRGADSIALLVEAAARVRAAGWAPVNVDSTIVAQAPKMAPHIASMRARLAQALGLGVD